MITLQSPTKTKKCTKCGEILPFSAFSPLSAGKYGLHPWCKKCRAKNTAAWIKKNPEKQKQYMKNWKEKRRTLAQREYFGQKYEFAKDVLGGYKIAILNHVRGNEKKYNIVRTDGKVFCTNDKGEFLSFLEKRI